MPGSPRNWACRHRPIRGAGGVGTFRRAGRARRKEEKRGCMETSDLIARARANGVKLSLHRCKIACVARPGQQVVAGDRLADRIGVGVLTKVFPPELVDRAVDET